MSNQILLAIAAQKLHWPDAKWRDGWPEVLRLGEIAELEYTDSNGRRYLDHREGALLKLLDFATENGELEWCKPCRDECNLSDARKEAIDRAVSRFSNLLTDDGYHRIKLVRCADYRKWKSRPTPESPYIAAWFEASESIGVTVKIFISYSHKEREYFPVFKDNFKDHAKFSNLAVEVFSDDGIPIGVAWDGYLQAQVAECDVMLLLVSQGFIHSDYIQEKEFGAAIQRLQAGRNLLIAPVYFAPCQFNSNEELARLQFFKPHGEKYGAARAGDDFAFTALVNFDNNRLLIPNAYNIGLYMTDLVKKLTPEIQKLAGNTSKP